MKSVFSLWVLVFILFSCEDVVDVDLPETQTRLIVDGLIRVDTTEQFLPVRIKFSETNDFFSDISPTQVESAQIVYGVPNPDAPELFDFLATSVLAEESPGSGIYVPDPNFTSDQRIPTASVTAETIFILLVTHNDRNYLARTPYSQTVPIDNITQGTDVLFDEEDTEIVITITDKPDEDNFYVFDFGFGEFLALDDQFIDGQEFEFSYFFDENLEPNDIAQISILGADLDFFNYMNLLIEQTDSNRGVFDTPAITVRGNVFDITDLDNVNVLDNVERPELFALGYFAVVQEFKDAITIE